MSRWHELFEESLPEKALSHGNRLTLITDGDVSFRRLWADIDRAVQRVWLEVYVFDPDEVGRRTRRKLIEAARRGCDVLVLYDSLGSPDMTAEFMAPLREAGATVVAFHTVYPWQKLARRLGNPLHRDHRKIVVIDDAIAYTGGRNIGEEYASDGLGNSLYYDTLLRVEGPATSAFARLFLQAFHAVSDVRREVPDASAVHADGASVSVAGLDLPNALETLHDLLRHAIEEARQRCFVTAAYFAAPPWLVQVLSDAARRGVDVRVLTAGWSDVWTSLQAKRHVYGSLLESGVRIYEMREKVLHAKNMVIDEAFGMVGSYNMDRWSHHHNLEVGMAVADEALAGQLADAFEQNLERSARYTLDQWHARSFPRRVLQSALYALMQV